MFKHTLLLTTFIGLVISTSLVNAQISNGTFEDWSNGNPDDWTTIDSGILLDQVSSPTVDGQNSTKVTVTTASQANTDFRQSVQVQANQSYDFQVSVYHTEGNVAARLYVDGYQGYSDNGVRNQWQQISYTYVATQTKTISVGVRFYDRSGFDGSEVVYIDSFQPTDPVITPTPGACTDTTVSINSDNYGSETSWQLRNSAGVTLGGDSNLASNQTFTDQFCLDDGDYTFVINDSYGDGICCQYGQGSYTISANGETLVSGGQFASSETKNFSISQTINNPDEPDLQEYYQSANGLNGQPLKTALHNIINGHAAQGYSALWSFYIANSLDFYYENDGSILDIYSENPNGADSYNFTASVDQCGSSGFSVEGDCYNREHSFPRSWFGGDIEPMNSDVHFIFASDGKVNSLRNSFPYGNVGSIDTVSNNGSKLGSAVSGSGYSGTVFEPNDEFKGDLARAAFYVATRYENIVSGWQNNTDFSDAVLDGSSAQVFETWYLNVLKQWHQQDPVSQKEIDRNNAAQIYQGNRNPFVDHPEFVEQIWGN